MSERERGGDREIQREERDRREREERERREREEIARRGRGKRVRETIIDRDRNRG